MQWWKFGFLIIILFVYSAFHLSVCGILLRYNLNWLKIIAEFVIQSLSQIVSILLLLACLFALIIWSIVDKLVKNLKVTGQYWKVTKMSQCNWCALYIFINDIINIACILKLWNKRKKWKTKLKRFIILMANEGWIGNKGVKKPPYFIIYLVLGSLRDFWEYTCREKIMAECGNPE